MEEFRQSLYDDLAQFQQVAAQIDGTVAGIRDQGELEGAVARPFMTGAGGHVFFLTPSEKAAALADSIIRRQPFLDGNKRAAPFGAARMLYMFGLTLEADPAELRDAVIALDAGHIGEDEFASWLEERAQSPQVDEAPHESNREE